MNAIGPKECPNAVAWRSMMAVWQRRVSYAPSAVTVPISSLLGDLIEQLRQNRAVTVAAWRKRHSADVRRGGVHRQMDLAPLASALDTVLSGLPFTVAEKLDDGAVDQEVWRPIGAPIRVPDSQGLLPPTQGRMIWHGPVQVRHLQQAGHHPGGLPPRQFELARGSARSGLNHATGMFPGRPSPLMVRQNRIAASQNTAGWPQRPSCGASHVMS